MSKRKPKPRRTFHPEEVERRRLERESKQLLAKKQAEQERVQGINPGDPSGRWLQAKAAGEPSPFLERPAGGWRDQPATAAQRGILRSLGLNPLASRTRGAATDAITAARTKKLHKR